MSRVYVCPFLADYSAGAAVAMPMPTGNPWGQEPTRHVALIKRCVVCSEQFDYLSFSDRAVVSCTAYGLDEAVAAHTLPWCFCSIANSSPRHIGNNQHQVQTSSQFEAECMTYLTMGFWQSAKRSSGAVLMWQVTGFCLLPILQDTFVSGVCMSCMMQVGKSLQR